MVHVTINGEVRVLDRELSLPEFLAAFQVDGRRIAVAYNGEVLYREDWPGVILHEGDRLEIVRMIGGGS